MRNALTTTVGMAFLLAAACSTKVNGTTNGSNGGASTGSTCESPGTSCSTDDDCCSGACGLNGTGSGNFCCATQCVAMGTDPCAAPTGCDDKGACVYPPMGHDCGPTCAGNMRRENSCDGTGACTAGTASACPNGLGCGATDCNTFCVADGGGGAGDNLCSGF